MINGPHRVASEFETYSILRRVPNQPRTRHTVQRKREIEVQSWIAKCFRVVVPQFTEGALKRVEQHE